MSAKHIFTTLAAFALFLASSGCNAQNKQENTNTITQSNNRAMNKIVIFFSHAGDIMLYGDNCVVVFYETFTTSYSYSPIGHITNSEGLKKALGTGTSTIVFTAQ